MGFCFALAVLFTGVAYAQERRALSLSPAQPAKWDVTGQVAWFGNNKSEIAEPWDRWYSTSAAGVAVGHYWTPHLRTEIAGTFSRAGTIYRNDPPVFVDGRPVFRPREHLIQATTLTSGVTYQFFENQWFHPFAGGGLELVRERQERDTVRYRYMAQPYLNAGFKVFVSPRAFVRTEIIHSFNSRGPSHLSWSGGVGVEF